MVEYTTKTLNEAVGLAAKTLPVRPTKPAEGLICFDISKKGTLIRTKTTENYTQQLLAVEGENSTWSVNGKQLAAALASCGGTKTTLSLTDDVLTIQSGTRTITLPTASHNVPKPPAAPSEIGTIDGKELLDAITKASQCTSINNPNEALNGIRIIATEKTFTCVATDRYRLVVATKPFTGTKDAEFTVPAAVAGMVKEFKNKQVSCRVDETYFEMSDKTLRMGLRVVAGEYPAWKNLLKQQGSNKVVVEGSLLKEAVVTWMNLRDGAESLVLDIKDDQITITGASSTNFEETIDASADEDVEIRFNPEYLKDGLMDATTTINFNGSSRAAVLNSPGITYLVMPVKK